MFRDVFCRADEGLEAFGFRLNKRVRCAGGFCKFDGREGFKFGAKFGEFEFSFKFSRQNGDEFDGRKCRKSWFKFELKFSARQNRRKRRRL